MMVTKVKMKALRYLEKPGKRNVARPNHFFNPVKRKSVFLLSMRPYRPWYQPLS
jgi:hypothetical protein